MPALREISTTSDTPGVSDVNKILRCTNAALTTITLATTGLSAGNSFGVDCNGTTVAFAAGSGTSSIVGDRFVRRGEAFVMYAGSGIFAVFGTGRSFTAEQFGAVGDGTTDDTAAIQAALNAAKASTDAAQGEPQQGGRVRLSAAMYLVSSTLTVPGNVSLIGEGTRATVLLADSAWNVGTSPYIVRLGDTSGSDRITSGNWLMDLEVNGNAISGLRGVYSTSISEHAGVRGVRFINCLLGAMKVEWSGTAGSTGAADHFSIVDVDDLLGVACDDNRIAFELLCLSNYATKCYLDRVTLYNDVTNVTSKQSAYGIFANGRSLNAQNIHLEGCAVGIYAGLMDGLDLQNVDGHPDTGYLVRLHSSMVGKAVHLSNIRDNGATVTIRTGADVDITGDVALWVDGKTRVPPGSVWLAATSFAATTGSPNLVTSTTIDATWRMDGASSEWIGAQVMAPQGWGTMKITLYWANVGTGSGSVTWRSSVATTGPGEVLNASPVTGTALTIAAPTVANQVVATVLDDDVAVTPNEILTIGINRFGTAGGDTLTADAAVVGVLLEPV